MKRPFFHDSINKLEEYFEERKSDVDYLNLLIEELNFRSTERAKKLRSEIINQLDNLKLDRKIKNPTPSQTSNEKIENISTTEIKEDPFKKDNISNSVTNKPIDILSAWVALEVLSPQTFKKPQDLAGSEGSIVYLNQTTLPWEGSGERSKPNYKLYYQIVLGTLNFEKAVENLLIKYSDQRIERPAVKGEAVLAVLVIDKNGFLVEDTSAYISSFGWGLNYALNGELSKLSKWSKVEELIKSELDKLLRLTNEKGEEIPVNRQTLINAKTYLERTLEIPKEYLTNSLFAIRTYQYFTFKESPEPILINSFYINDLIFTKALFNEGKATNNLELYLGSKRPDNKKDILHNNKSLETAIAPSLTPAGRWPSKGLNPLVLLQQAAVNIAFKDLHKQGILGINGPPGTGKTTLLRDIIAGIVTSRAEAMLQFDNPSEAFVNSGHKVLLGQSWITLYNLHESLKGFEILITSSNNKAVENVSAELPVIDSISEEIDDLRYFKTISDELLEQESWGLIAAVLGNANNRSKFKRKFWWDKDYGMATYLTQASGTPQLVEILDETGTIIGNREPLVISNEKPPYNHNDALLRWKETKKDFKEILEKTKNELLELEKVRNQVIILPSLEASESLIKIKYHNSIQAENNAIIEFEAAKKDHELKKDILKSIKNDILLHKKDIPNFLSRIFNSSKNKIWKEKQSELHQKEIAAEKHLKKIASILIERENKWTECTKDFKRKEKEYIEISNKLSYAKNIINEAKSRLGIQIIDESFFSLTHKQKHLTIPWIDKKVQDLRNKVFVQAMKMHKSFIDVAARPIRHNLNFLMKILTGPTLNDNKKLEVIQDIWATLFLIVPAVSTTFASVERMLGKLPPQSLGWLLIDEAGQALPQAAIGAILRTKRAIIVGDPIQIEPVVTLPNNLTNRICHHFNIDPNRYNAPKASAQTLADEASNYFAVFEGRNGSRTVGLPLLVHRRCNDPMFRISNSIAYEHLMVQAKKPGKSNIQDFLGPSRWININGTATNKWSPEEGEVVLDILQRLRSKGIFPDLYIISPFVIVAESLRKKIIESKVLETWVENASMWPYERIGTVHTVQGREAEAVIFVLGAPLPQQAGARNWAGGFPNLINVAVTRAKEVMYVIGNKDVWKNAGLFLELSKHLP